MKYFTACLTAVLLAPCCSIAFASTTITLGSEPCTSTSICYAVKNDAGVTIDYISWASQHERLVVSIDGEMYDSEQGAVTSLTNVPLYAADGTVLYATVSFNVQQEPCVREGRATICPRFVMLMGGTLISP